MMQQWNIVSKSIDVLNFSVYPSQHLPAQSEQKKH